MCDGKLIRHTAMQECVPENGCEDDPQDTHHRADTRFSHASIGEEFGVPGSKYIDPEEHK